MKAHKVIVLAVLCVFTAASTGCSTIAISQIDKSNKIHVFNVTLPFQAKQVTQSEGKIEKSVIVMPFGDKRIRSEISEALSVPASLYFASAFAGGAASAGLFSSVEHIGDSAGTSINVMIDEKGVKGLYEKYDANAVLSGDIRRFELKLKEYKGRYYLDINAGGTMYLLGEGEILYTSDFYLSREYDYVPYWDDGYSEDDNPVIAEKIKSFMGALVNKEISKMNEKSKGIEKGEYQVDNYPLNSFDYPPQWNPPFYSNDMLERASGRPRLAAIIGAGIGVLGGAGVVIAQTNDYLLRLFFGLVYCSIGGLTGGGIGYLIGEAQAMEMIEKAKIIASADGCVIINEIDF